MDLINCKLCGKLFKNDQDILCKKCSEKLNNPYKKIKNYLYSHGESTILELAEATGISKSLVLKYIREGRFILNQKNNM